MPELLVQQRRVPHRHLPLGLGGAVGSTRLKSLRPVSPSASSSGLAIVALREQEPRLGAVDGGEPAQPPQHVARRASRTRRGRRAPRRRRRRPGWRTGRPSAAWWGRIPTWSMSGLVRIRLLRLRIAGALVARRVAVVDRRADLLVQAEARAAPAPGPGPAPWSGTGRAPAPCGRRSATSSVGELKAQRLARRGARGDHRRALEGLEQRVGLV